MRPVRGLRDILANTTKRKSTDGVRLVRGSHIITRKLYDHAKCYVLQGNDGRIIFVIPYETDFTLIGTTDIDHPDLSTKVCCSPEEREYLLAFASRYFARPLTDDDVVATFSGVRRSMTMVHSRLRRQRGIMSCALIRKEMRPC